MFHIKKALLATFILGSIFTVQRSFAATPDYAMITINQQAIFFNLMNKGAEDESKATGKNLVVYNPNNQPVAQNNAIENYIQQGVKGIIVDAIDVNGIMPAIQEAAQKDIPVIAVDAVLPEGPQASQVGVNNIKGGQILGQYFLDYVTKNMDGKARLGIVGALNSAIQNNRQKGFTDTLTGHSGISIADVVDGRNIQDQAMTAAENLITANPDLNAIYATGEPALLGAIAAVENQGKKNQIKIFGWDLTAEAIKGIDSGFVIAVLQQDPETMGKEAVKALNAITEGKSVEKEIMVPATVVDTSNVETFRSMFK